MEQQLKLKSTDFFIAGEYNDGIQYSAKKAAPVVKHGYDYYLFIGKTAIKGIAPNSEEGTKYWQKMAVPHFVKHDVILKPHHCTNDWTEITQDNVEDVYKIPSERIVVAHKTCGRIDYLISYNWHPTLNDMAKRGGYYYIELPELKVNEL